MANPRVIEKGTIEYKRLEAVAALLQAVSPNDAKYIVMDVYFDYGQDWMWTTICRRGYSECQVLNPRDWEQILRAETLEDLKTAAEVVISDEYFGDKTKGQREW